MAPMPVIYLVRHAQASFGDADYDVLSDLGHRQSAVLDGVLIARRARVTRIVSGSLRRQLDTARACATVLPGAPRIDARWNEYDSAQVVAHHARAPGRAAPDDGIGAAPGMTSAEFQAVLDDALLAWIAAGESTSCAESWAAFQGRATAALDELASGLGTGEDALVISSGGTIAAVAAALISAPPETFVALNRISVNAGCSKVIVGRSGLRLLSYNEHAHLEQEPGMLTFR